MSKRAYSQLFYHFAWATKGRERLISQQMKELLCEHITDKCRTYGYVLLAVNAVEDHMHLLVRAEPDIAPSTIAGKLKGASSHYINSILPAAGRLKWQSGFGVFSVGKRHLQTVVAYIENQENHHKAGAFDSEWEEIDDAPPPVGPGFILGQRQ